MTYSVKNGIYKNSKKQSDDTTSEKPSTGTPMDKKMVAQVIEEQKKIGNGDFTQKDLMLYILHKVDSIDNNLDAHIKYDSNEKGKMNSLIAGNSAKISMLMWGVGLGVPATVAVLLVIFNVLL